MVRVASLLALLLAVAATALTAVAVARPPLPVGTAVATAKAVLIQKAKKAGVKIRVKDARATCTKDPVETDTFSCRLAERHRRCHGTVVVYSAASTIPLTRSAVVRCTKKH